MLLSASSQCARGGSAVARVFCVLEISLPILVFVFGQVDSWGFSPCGVFLNLLCFFVLFNSLGTDTKLSLYRMRRLLLFNLPG